jgi:hypothetical protein
MDTTTSTADTFSSKSAKDNLDKLDNVQQMVSDLDKIMKSGSAKSPSAPAVPEAEKVPSVDPSLASWARNLAAKEAALRARESYADARDTELWRRESDLHNIESRGPATATTSTPQNLSATNGTKEDGTKSAIKLKQDAIADMNASSTGVTLTPDKLGQMDKSGLKELGVNINEPFIISVKLNGKLIHVRVAKITSQGKTFLAPSLNDDNREIKEVVLKSPVFNDFRQYFQQRSIKMSDLTKI